jgi:hypothetical protein
MLFQDFLEASHLRNGRLLAEGTVLDHILVFLGHEFIEARREFDIIETHVDASLSVSAITSLGGCMDGLWDDVFLNPA